MTGKRKRGEVIAKEQQAAAPLNGTPKPMSAIAAARLRAEQAAAPIPQPEGVLEPPPSPLDDSPASEAVEPEQEDISLIPQNFKLSTWRKSKTTILSDTAKELTIILEKHSTASFVGVFDLKVLKGAVHINGANIGASKEGDSVLRVYVPSTHPITKIRGLDRTNHVQLRSCHEATPFADINPLFADIWGGDVDSDKGRSFSGVTETDDDPLKRPLVPEHAPEDWLRSIDEITSTANTTFVVGSPACGKSTFAKRMANRYLTGFGKTVKSVPEVCYLDLDPSSQEYTPHGQISLTIVRELNLGPSFTHPTTALGRSAGNEMIAAHVLPHQDLTNYEDHFTSCAEHLFQTYRNLRFDGRTPPLIVDIPGTLYVSHFPLLQKLLASTKPSRIVHLYPKASIDEVTAANLHTLHLHAQKTQSKLHELAAQPPVLPQARTPADLRAMHMASYFHLTSLDPTTYTTAPLTALTPWTFAYAPTPKRTQDILAVLPLFADAVPPTTLLTAINGSILHIIRTTRPPDSTPPSRTPKSQIPFYPASADTHLPPLPSPSTSTLVCAALLRGVDPVTRTFQLLVPPVFEAALEALEPERTVLVAGCADTPEWSYAEDAYASLAARRRELGDRARFVGDAVVGEGVERGPWVAEGAVVEGMGYAGAVRRVRRFLD